MFERLVQPLVGGIPVQKPFSAETLQPLTFSVGKEHKFENLRGWFQALYEVLLGQSQGPRFGGFIALYGLEETAQLIEEALAR